MDFDVDRLYDRRADKRWERVAVGDILERMTWSDPEKIALIATPDAVMDPAFARVTYRTANSVANQIAHALLVQGLERGDRVAMLCDNSVEACLVKFGIAKAGLVAMPINTMMAPDVVQYVLQHVDARVAIVDNALWAGAAATFAAAGVRVLATIGGEPVVAGATSLRAFIATMPETEPDIRIHGDDIWQILLTSGTTAMPKAVMISHTFSTMAAMGNALAYSRGVAVESDFRVCSFLPLIFHIGDQCFLLAPMMTGGSLVIGRRVDAAAMAQAISRERPTALWGGSPAIVGDLVVEVEAHPGRYDLGSLQVLVYGWAAMPPEIHDKLQTLCGGVLLVGIFGQTEAIACTRFRPSVWPETYRRTAPSINVVGQPSPLLGATVMDADGVSLHDRPGQPGEAVYRSPCVTAGYFRDKAATREAFRHGWFHSGDLCTVDEDGLRVMIDRLKDVVKSGGENVSSQRVESVLMQHPSVQRAAVIGLPDPRWGEAVTGVIILRGEEIFDEPALIAFCRQRLGGFETPKRIVVLDQLPVTVGGKVLKYKLRQWLAAAQPDEKPGSPIAGDRAPGIGSRL